MSEIEWLRDRVAEAFGLLREHQDVHGTAADKAPPLLVLSDTDPVRLQLEQEAHRWRTRRDQFIEEVASRRFASDTTREDA